MLRSIYLGVGAFCLVGYLGWAVLGKELGSPAGDPVPKIPRASSSASGYGGSRSSGGFFGGGGGFGK